MNDNKITLLVTAPELFDSTTRSIESAVEEVIAGANSEIHIATYLLTSSAMHIINQLEKSAKKGVKVKILVDKMGHQEKIVKDGLRALGRYPNVLAFSFSDPRGWSLHAKVVIADRRRAVIGSANLSWSGMVANYEIGVLVEGEMAWKLANIIDRLIGLGQARQFIKQL
jgi:phosphatidylserine/phosphatidylglycerophosphate/cardiolipin synthase-like enzyme